MIWDSIKGHAAQVEHFRRAVSRQRLAHAYLLVGTHGIGKRLFARTLAQCLFCERMEESELDACGECPQCQQVRANTHPDLLTVECPEGKRELPVALLMGSRERRGREGLCYELALRPMSATRRVAIVDDAELMSEESANGLLKTLEEPPQGSIIFLLTPDTDSILPTIRSRCQPVQFAPLSDADLTDLILEQHLTDDASTASQTAVLAQGSLSTAKELLEPELRGLRAVVVHHLSAPGIQPLRTVADVTAALDKFGSDSSVQRKYAGWVVQFAVEQLRLKLHKVNDPTQADILGTMLERCLETELHLRQTMPVPMCLEALFDALARIQRGGELARSV